MIALIATFVVLAALVVLADLYRRRHERRRASAPPAHPRVDAIRALDDTGDEVDATVFRFFPRS